MLLALALAPCGTHQNSPNIFTTRDAVSSLYTAFPYAMLSTLCMLTPDALAWSRVCTQLKQGLIMWMGNRGAARTQYGDINTWDVSRVTDMNHLCDAIPGAETFNDPIGNWDVSAVTDMSDMLDACSNFDQDITGWDVSRVTTMAQMCATSTKNGAIPSC